ncbi:MAG: hypothetical protein WCL61_01530 [bacterium]
MNIEVKTIKSLNDPGTAVKMSNAYQRLFRSLPQNKETRCPLCGKLALIGAKNVRCPHCAYRSTASNYFKQCVSLANNHFICQIISDFYHEIKEVNDCVIANNHQEIVGIAWGHDHWSDWGDYHGWSMNELFDYKWKTPFLAIDRLLIKPSDEQEVVGMSLINQLMTNEKTNTCFMVIKKNDPLIPVLKEIGGQCAQSPLIPSVAFVFRKSRKKCVN